MNPLHDHYNYYTTPCFLSQLLAAKWTRREGGGYHSESLLHELEIIIHCIVALLNTLSKWLWLAVI